MIALRQATGQPGTASFEVPTPLGREGIAAGGVLGAATVAMGLISGLFYAFACAVMLGLARTDDRTLVDVAQKINVAILNPVFGMSFFGALGLTATAAVLSHRLGPGKAFRWVVTALGLYVCALAITIGASVPLNDALARAGDPARIANLAAVRHRFEGPWVAWNITRTVLSTMAFACLVRALVVHGREQGKRQALS